MKSVSDEAHEASASAQAATRAAAGAERMSVGLVPVRLPGGLQLGRERWPRGRHLEAVLRVAPPRDPGVLRRAEVLAGERRERQAEIVGVPRLARAPPAGVVARELHARD